MTKAGPRDPQVAVLQDRLSKLSKASLRIILGTPICHRGTQVGNFYLAEKESGPEFTDEDEETLGMFVGQAALALANARQHRNEQRARADLEALIDTSPVGVVVFDTKLGQLVSLNREASRIVGDLLMPGHSLEQLLEVLTFRRADGREVSLKESSLAQTLRTGETVRAEEVVVQGTDGPSVTILVNATPLYSEDLTSYRWRSTLGPGCSANPSPRRCESSI